MADDPCVAANARSTGRDENTHALLRLRPVRSSRPIRPSPLYVCVFVGARYKGAAELPSSTRLGC